MTVVDERVWWDSHAEPIYVWGERGWHQGTVDCMAHLLEQTGPIADGCEVLEIGCGLGRLTLPLAAMLPRVFVMGIDVSSRMIEQARHDRDLALIPNLHYTQCDGRSIPRKWNGYAMPTFDVIYSVLVFQHLDPDGVRAYLAEVAAMLKPEGRFVCQFVRGSDREWMSNGYELDEIHRWGAEVGLRRSGVAIEGGVHNEWVWMAMERAR